jgi:putative transposase
MNLPKCSEDDYINFVIATPRWMSATEAAKVQGDEKPSPAHDAFTRLLHRMEPDAVTLWTEARSQISLSKPFLS